MFLYVILLLGFKHLLQTNNHHHHHKQSTYW
uniref:Uncharacterized protein n=1 Tax=Siphoviridae sp. ctWdm1 TaxID=2827883 RepID=A0A8S5RYF7_9CAUD|nr:MAG TPA: hypothetical protein [Siphoviridae sp. ctWdm1]